MLKVCSNSVLASEIAEFLNKELVGEDVVVYDPVFVRDVRNNSMAVLSKEDEAQLDQFDLYDDVLIFTENKPQKEGSFSYIVSEEAEKDFVRVVKNFFTRSVEAQIHPQALIEQGATIGNNVTIMSGVYIGPDVSIGDDTIILQNSVITGKVTIGQGCMIKANATIGSELFDFIELGGQWEQFPQMGQIIIGDNVWIGANTTVEKGSLKSTVIDQGVRIDDLVQVGSGASIGANVIIASGAVICRQVSVGSKSWIAPNASILDQLKIGKNVTIGLGAVVIDDVESGMTVAGNPAKEIKKH